MRDNEAKTFRAAHKRERVKIAMGLRMDEAEASYRSQRDEAISLLEYARYDAGDNDSMREEEALRAKIGGA